MTLRVLVTGSRGWTDQITIGSALSDAWKRHGGTDPLEPMIVVHGGARGADTIADDWVRYMRDEWRLPVSAEVHRADWERHGKPAGHIRNAEMVKAGATVCLAFPAGEARGTRGCMALAARAGIPVIEHAPRGGATQ